MTESRKQPASSVKEKVQLKLSRRYLLYIFGVIILIAAGAWLVIDNLSIKESIKNNVSDNGTDNETDVSTTIVPAATGEILIVVTLFNTGDVDFNVIDQIVTILRRESTNKRIQNVRIEEYAQVITKNEQALQIIKEKGAVMVIYGESNSSLVTVNILPMSGQIPEVAVIDYGDRISINALSIAALGKVCIDTQNIEQAYSFIYKARNLLNDCSIVNDSIITITNELLTEVNIISGK